MIRDYKPEDISQITAICNYYIDHSTATFEIERVTEQAMAHRLESVFFPMVDIDSGGAVRGYCYAHPWKERAAYSHTWETTVYVGPDYLGLGLGEQLYRRLIDRCRTTDCRALIGCITADNTASRRLNEKLGFLQVSLFKSVGYKFGKWLDVADYELLLK